MLICNLNFILKDFFKTWKFFSLDIQYSFGINRVRIYDHKIPRTWNSSLYYFFHSLPRRSLRWKHEKANIKKIAKEQQQDRNILMQRKMWRNGHKFWENKGKENEVHEKGKIREKSSTDNGNFIHKLKTSTTNTKASILRLYCSHIQETIRPSMMMSFLFIYTIIRLGIVVVRRHELQ